MAESSIPVTGGSGYNVGGTIDGAGNFLQSVGVEDTVSGNVTNVVAGDTGFNGLATTSGTKTYTFTTSLSGAQTLLANTSCEGYSTIEVVYTSVGSGLALTIPFSTASGGTYVATNTWFTNNGTGTSVTAANSTICFSGIHGNFFQIAISALTSGTFTGTVTLSNRTLPTSGVNATQQGTWTVGSNSATGVAVPANVFPVGLSDGTNLLAMRTGLTDGNTSATLDTDLFIYNGTNKDRVRSATAAASTTGTGLLGTGILVFDGTNWQTAKTANNDNLAPNTILGTAPLLANSISGPGVDRQRNNITGVVIAAGATTAQTSSTVTTYNASKLIVAINISAFTSGTLTFTVNGITSSGYTYPILVSTALASTGVTPLRIFPSATSSPNAVANDMVPRSFNVVVTGTFSATYGVDYELGV